MSGRVHLRRGESDQTYCGLALSGVRFIETTPEVVESGAGAGYVTCEICGDRYRAAQTRARRQAERRSAN
jgi:hypothetical protein